MKPGAGKQKGAEFERAVCKRLSLWVSDKRRDDLFWRSAMSGGRATLSKKSQHTGAGDITAVAVQGNKLTNEFYIECKFYADLDMPGFVYCTGGKLKQFWLETIKQAVKYGRRPFLIAKENRRPTLLLLDTFQPINSRATHLCLVESFRQHCCVFNFELFIEEFDYSEVLAGEMYDG